MGPWKPGVTVVFSDTFKVDLCPKGPNRYQAKKRNIYAKKLVVANSITKKNKKRDIKKVSNCKL